MENSTLAMKREGHLGCAAQERACGLGLLRQVAHNAGCIARPLVLSRLLCVPIPEDLQRVASVRLAYGQQAMARSVVESTNFADLSCNMERDLLALIVGKPCTPNLVAKALLPSSVASTCHTQAYWKGGIFAVYLLDLQIACA